MKRFLVAAACAAMFALPAGAAERKTDLVEDGKPVETMSLRDDFNATWVLDQTRVLMRDTYFKNYLITLAKPCVWLQPSVGFSINPVLKPRARASLDYVIRDGAHEDCRIARVETVEAKAAQEMRKVSGQ